MYVLPLSLQILQTPMKHRLATSFLQLKASFSMQLACFVYRRTHKNESMFNNIHNLKYFILVAISLQ